MDFGFRDRREAKRSPDVFRRAGAETGLTGRVHDAGIGL